MTKTIKFKDFDVVYLSYDEPNADENYADLLVKIPHAKRVHGVFGSDNAHKACAKIAETDRVIIIDGDNKIYPGLLKQEVTFVSSDIDNKSVVSFGARNIINGLIYGNGGIKCWPTELVLNMRTHENAESDNSKTQVDFCWDINYIQMDKCMSDVYNNSTPLQAWRAGFREGVKMSLIEGSKISQDTTFSRQIHWKNLHRLLIWMTVGSDVKNGVYAILGARQGCFMTNSTDWDYTNVRDFSFLNQLFVDTVKEKSEDEVLEEITTYGLKIEKHLQIPCPTILGDAQNQFFKTVYINPPRMKSKLVVDNV
jgi:hypothetical protein